MSILGYFLALALVGSLVVAALRPDGRRRDET